MWQRRFLHPYTVMAISSIQSINPRVNSLLDNKILTSFNSWATFHASQGFIEPKWLAYGEIIDGRYAMLGAVGAIAPEILGSAGLVPPETALPWFRTGVIPPARTYNYWADPFTLFLLEMALIGFAEHRRFQDWAKPGPMGKQYFLGFEKYLGGSEEPAYPGGPLFNPLGFGKDEKSFKDLKLKEVKSGRLAICRPSCVTGVGPYQNLLDHLAE
ncbi:unnamed protein product [Dovyalis caffra]|uniref:Chlorophyll a-b binding protein, chloroplastic n=1 Tax=Dovyalis caffra TaxID=77055 RepID=A0AAV1SCR6_9ROSI|nr:unnamed protein product [Dovyalis caffra]